MAQKRSRAAFEADLQAHQSPYVVYGTPLPPLDPDVRDDGSYVPVWKQEVTDEQGRKRLHGAFTGGFSAGYFNTVGSKEGWTPATFVSSRTDRQKNAASHQQRPEDFMDDEDRADVEDSRRIQTKDSFAGLGSTRVDERHQEPFMDLFRTTGETMGTKLLKKMGWREGQGVGPKIKREARLDDENQDAIKNPDSKTDSHLFAPSNTRMISFVRKDDCKGLGFGGETPLTNPGPPNGKDASADLANEDQDGDPGFGTSAVVKKPKKKAERRTGIGMGILNDNGSDDEDPYSMGPNISYNRVIGGDKKKKQTKAKTFSNPLLSSKPVFIPKKSIASKGRAVTQRCHDGRLPLDGFVLFSELSIDEGNKFESSTPKIPDDWKSSKIPLDPKSSSSDQAAYMSTADVAANTRLSPKSRAAALGESQLPGKSVFDFLNPAARDRLATATKNPNLPPALGERHSGTDASQTKTMSSLVPELDREVALTALGRGTTGWMPYSEDLSKRARYRTFLEIQAGLRSGNVLPDRAPGASNDDWVNEMNEFSRAAQIFKPMTGTMASRFTSSSSTPRLASDNVKMDVVATEGNGPQLMSQAHPKEKSTAEEAAATGMYGPLTRSVVVFYPTRLLCKRFNVKPPSHVQMEASDAQSDPAQRTGDGFNQHKGPPPTHSTALPQKQLELVGKKEMDVLRMTSSVVERSDRKAVIQGGMETEEQGAEVEKTIDSIDPERNEALEKERPGEAVFKAIFGSDSEDE